jgi:8-amino-7-oxononanoate synthase
MLHFGSNDYLSLAWHPKVQEVYQRRAIRGRVGAVASPLISGAGSDYHDLVDAIKGWEAAESAMVFSSGYAANLGTIAAVAGREDLILSDALNHACLIDGCRLTRASVRVYPHSDMACLENLLDANRSNHRFAFVVTDTVFSMDGDIARVADLQAICEQHDAIAIADEAHASGVLGEHGRGVLGTFEFEPSRWIRTGTLSKAIGCSGGFVSGSQLLVRWLTHQARSWIYSTALPAATLGAAVCAIELLQGMDRERAELANKSLWLRHKLIELGFSTRLDPTPIIPVYFHDPRHVLTIAKRLAEAGIYVPAIRPPTVPRDTSLLRISITISHTYDDLERLLETLNRVAFPTETVGS